MCKQITAAENLQLFDKMRIAAIESTNDAIMCVKEMIEDPDFSTSGKKTLEKLEYSKHILEDNTLPISLMASFQQGKSTTTAAMADGRVITPCGQGIRTSSIPVTIYNSKFSTELTINPYSKQVLTQHVIDSCSSYLDNTSTDAYDLDEETSRSLLESAVKQEIESYRNASNYDPEKMSLLRSAILILSFYNCDEYKNLLNGHYKTISDIQPFIAFPADLESRWEHLKEYGFDIVKQCDSDGKPLFDAKSSLYVFVDNIVVPVHSEFMGETGTAIIDAPGTMASNEDTERALNAAASAAVVLFLVTGNTQLSSVDIEMLRTLKNAGMAEKVVFIVNFFKNPDVIKDNIEKTIISQIQSVGYTSEHHKKLLYYNAFLAQRAAQGQLFLDHNMDPLTANSIVADANSRKTRFTTVEDAWLKTTRKVLRAIDADDTADKLSELGLCQETVELIAIESKWKEMIISLREHVMNNRVSGVLKDLGVQPVNDGLEAIEEALKAKEKATEITLEKIKKEYEEAKRLLEMFSDEVEDVVSVNLNQSIDKVFAESYYDEVILGAIYDTAKGAAPEVFAQTGIIGNIRDIADKAKRLGEKAINAVADFLVGEKPIFEHDPNGLREQCNAIISRHYRRVILEKGHAWSQGLESSAEYADNIKTKVKHIQKSLKRTWNNLALGENALLSEISPFQDNFSGEISKDAASIDVRDIISNTTAAAQIGISALFKGVGIGFGTLVGGTWIYYFVLPADFIIPGFAEVITLASVIVAALVYAIAAGKKAKKIESIEEEIIAGLTKTVSIQKKRIIENTINGDMNNKPPIPGVSCIRLFYVTLFEGIVEKQRKELDDAYKEKLKVFEKSSEEKERIAEKAKKWRTERVEPIRKKLSEMLNQIDSIWG